MAQVVDLAGGSFRGYWGMCRLAQLGDIVTQLVMCWLAQLGDIVA